MGHMFDLYPQPDDYIPNNRPKPHKVYGIDIMVGETSSHTFEIPFDVVSDCDEVKVIYKVGIEVVLVKDDLNIQVETREFEVGGEMRTFTYSIITDEVTPEETLLFSKTLLDASVQLKFVMKGGNITYSEIYKVNVTNSLDKGKE